MKKLDFLINNECAHLAPSPRAKTWGCAVSRVGCGSHAAGRDFRPNNDCRTLHEFALVYITRGGGEFHSGSDERREVRTGDLMLLFPEVPHRYREDPQVGWNEYWVLFDGNWARTIQEEGLLNPNQPLLRPGLDEELHRGFIHLLDLARASTVDNSLELAATTMQIIARSISLNQTKSWQAHRHSERIKRAMLFLEEHRDSEVDCTTLATSLNLSYPHFRRLFREIAGVPPHQYHLAARLQRAKELLEEDELSVGEIAYQLGFADPYYFSRIFKKKTGVQPSHWHRM